MMDAYEIQAGSGLSSLKKTNRTSLPLPANGLRLRMKAAALNSRDLSVARGQFTGLQPHPVVPLVDGCGEVVETGPDVTRFRVGDRVIPTYYPGWLDGRISPHKTAASFGVQIDGTLTTEMVGPENGFTRAPRNLDDAEAATLCCAGLTAWNALFVAGAARPGARVLLLGTGNVSLMALVLAKAAGLSVLITSSQNERLQRARVLGADETVNYRLNPEWQEDVLRQTGGTGVDLVLEVGGEHTLPRSLKATAVGGRVVVIGRLSGGGDVPISTGALIGGSRSLSGITAGSRTMLEDLIRFVEVNGIRPVMDTRFSFENAASAYEHFASDRPFGKVAITIDS
ncbi:MAG: NAD(P)-dependent alcohol dehydrogenase [Gluconobacter potus]|nr:MULTISPECIES: NAD(P)-dependent alcohol dehydrogenase [Gluconobacter]